MSAFHVDGGFTVDRNELEIDGNFYLGAYASGTTNQTYTGLIGSGAEELTLDRQKKYYSVQATASLYGGAVQLSVNFSFDANDTLTILAKASAHIPNAIPIIGGDELASVDFLLVIHTDDFPDSFAAVWTKIDILFVHVEIGVEFTLDGLPRFIGAGTINQLVSAANANALRFYIHEYDTTAPRRHLGGFWRDLAARWDPVRVDSGTERVYARRNPDPEYSPQCARPDRCQWKPECRAPVRGLHVHSDQQLPVPGWPAEL